jgi:hypothetical protein
MSQANSSNPLNELQELKNGLSKLPYFQKYQRWSKILNLLDSIVSSSSRPKEELNLCIIHGTGPLRYGCCEL